MEPRSAEAIVLRRRDYAENDRILTLLTREYGRVVAIAKGCRKPGSRNTGVSEPFTRSRVMLAPGRSLDIVTQWEIIQTYAALRKDLGSIARATYACDVAAELTTDREPCPDAFELVAGLLQSLTKIAAAGQELAADMVLHSYEARLLTERGYGLCLDRCVQCGVQLEDIASGFAVGFSPLAGGVLCRRCRYRVRDALPVSPEAVRVLARLAVAGYEECRGISAGSKVVDQVAQCLWWSVRHHCERELASARLLAAVRQTDGERQPGTATRQVR